MTELRRVLLAAGLDDQDHPWAKDGYVAVVALQGGDRGFVGGGDGVESFATFHLVSEHGGSAGASAPGFLAEL